MISLPVLMQKLWRYGYGALGSLFYEGSDGVEVELAVPADADIVPYQLVVDPDDLVPAWRVAPPGSVASGTFLISGGTVAWSSLYIYRVGAAVYYLNGALTTSAEQTVTLTAADATYDRIDVLVLDASGILSSIDGVASSSPAEPVVDPGTYLRLGIVIVTALSSSAPVTETTLYKEGSGGEWTGAASSGAIVISSTVGTPRTGTKDIEGTAVAAGVNFTLTIPSSSIDLATQDKLVLYIRPKAAWPTHKGFTLQWYAGTTPKGTLVTVSNGLYGFSRTVIGYQQIVVPMSAFGVPAGSAITKLRWAVTGSGASVGFDIDDIVLQSGATTVGTQADFRWRGDWSSATAYEPNDVVHKSGALYIALTGSTNQNPDTATAFWVRLALDSLSGDLTTGGTGGSVATLASIVTAATKGDATHVPQITYDAKGRITGVTEVAISGGGGGLSYQGTWNATTNSPAIPAAGSGNNGWYYYVATAGTTTIDGISDWGVGDWIISNGTTWQKIDNSDIVTSVFGRVGTVVAVAGDYPETKGGTGQTTYALGDLLYASATNVLAKLAGNIVATKMFLSQTGTGSVSAAPAWAALVAGDIPSLAASIITSGLLSMARGGTGVDLSASGGATFVLAQDAAHVISARALIAADIPNLDAAKITTGQLALARGGTNADLSATGGSGQYLKQSSSGAAITVGTIPAGDLPVPAGGGSAGTGILFHYIFGFGGS